MATNPWTVVSSSPAPRPRKDDPWAVVEATEGDAENRRAILRKQPENQKQLSIPGMEKLGDLPLLPGAPIPEMHEESKWDVPLVRLPKKGFVPVATGGAYIPSVKPTEESRIESPIARGAARGATEAAEGLGTPRNLAIAGGLAAVNLAQLIPGSQPVTVPIAQATNTAASTYFAVDMAKGAIESIPAFREAVERGDEEEAARILVGTGASAAMSAMAAKHAIKGGFGPARAEVRRRVGVPVMPEIPKEALAKLRSPEEPKSAASGWEIEKVEEIAEAKPEVREAKPEITEPTRESKAEPLARTEVEPEPLSASLEGPRDIAPLDLPMDDVPPAKPIVEPPPASGESRYSISPNLEQSRGNFIDQIGSQETRELLNERLAEYEKQNPERRVLTDAEIREEAKLRDPGKLFELDKDAAIDELVRDLPMRRAAEDMLSSVNQRIFEINETLRKNPNLPEAEAEAFTKQRETLNRDFNKLADVLLPTRSHAGRSLRNYQLMAEQSFNVDDWLSKARRSLRLKDRDVLPGDVSKKVQDATAAGQAAEDAAVRKVLGSKVRAEAEREVAAEAAEDRAPASTEKVSRYRNRVMEKIDEKLSGTYKGRKPSKWELTPEERREVDLDPEVRKKQMDLARTMATLDKDGWRDFILALRSAGLLTATGTHIRNLASTGAFQLFNEASRPAGMVMDFALNNFRKGAGKRTVEGFNPKGIIRASVEGARKGWNDAIEILKTGQVPDEGTDLIDFRRELNAGHLAGGRMEPVVKAINGVFRTLKAEDRFIKRYAFRRSLDEQMKLAGVDKPTEEMMAQAWTDADFMTFNNPNKAATALNVALGWAEGQGTAGKAGSTVLKFFVPFRNTPANVWMRGMEATGFGIPVSLIKALASEGKLTEAQQRAISMEFGRGLTGVGLMMLGFYAYKNGWMTGMTAPDERGERSVNEAAGRQDGAVKIGDKWVQILGLSPIANVAITGATLAKYYDDPMALFDSPEDALATMSATVKEQPMLKGVQDLIESVESRSASRLAASAAGSFVPSIVNQVGQLTDPVRRDTAADTFGQRVTRGVMGRVPGLRQMLPERVDLMGKPVPQSRFASTTGFSATTESPDPVIQELVSVGVPVSKSPQRKAEYEEAFAARKFRYPGATQQTAETDEAYKARLARQGIAIRRSLERLMQIPGYQAAPPEAKEDMAKDAIAKARASNR